MSAVQLRERNIQGVSLKAQVSHLLPEADLHISLATLNHCLKLHKIPVPLAFLCSYKK